MTLSRLRGFWPHGRKPRQSDLKRAISTAYYAMFHTLCRNCADCFIGGAGSARSSKAWQQAYRAADHGFAASQCRNRSVMSKFPKAIEDFASMFADAKEKRHSADYDPNSRYTRSEAITDIEAAEVAIRGFTASALKDRRAFAAWVTIRPR